MADVKDDYTHEYDTTISLIFGMTRKTDVDVYNHLNNEKRIITIYHNPDVLAHTAPPCKSVKGITS